MKIYNPKHEATINVTFHSMNEEAKEGEIVPHAHVVHSCDYYMPFWMNDREVFLKILLSRDMIIDLAKQIDEIEKDVKNMPFSDLPF